MFISKVIKALRGTPLISIGLRSLCHGVHFIEVHIQRFYRKPAKRGIYVHFSDMSDFWHHIFALEFDHITKRQ